ncbi:hypothetical protein Ahy_B06g080592 [Arachis hypogaea]|uniref:SWIM-type domain-containing protein n=1 Tax=Arachis hypogaea TaxID=3818 RepID=A0A444YIM9_ARAHY|nr:hypothetical protein Ahy_B06g080592 [Arachis hypogaea]
MAARSRQAALDEIQGTYRTQYKRIADYCSELLRSNPGSIVKLKVQRSLDFENECRRFIVLDGCFLKTPQGGSAIDYNREEVFWPSLEATDIEVCKDYTLEGLRKGDGSDLKESRKKPIVTMLEEIRIRKKIERRSRSVGEWRPYWSAAQSYEVVNGLNKYAVDLSARECSCRKWQLSGHSIHSCHQLHQL